MTVEAATDCRWRADLAPSRMRSWPNAKWPSDVSEDVGVQQIADRFQQLGERDPAHLSEVAQRKAPPEGSGDDGHAFRLGDILERRR